jgi:diguanylate cyclase (GGDEF)-like protein
VVQEFEVTRGERTYACTVVPVLDALGTVSAGMAMVYDVTTLKRVERELRRQTLVFQATLEHMREGVVTVSADGAFGVFNRAAKSLLGAQPPVAEVDALLDTMTFFEQDGVTPLPKGTDPLGRALRGKASSPSDVVMHTAHAAPVHLHVTVDPILDDGNALLGTVAVLHDVTAQRIAERLAREESASVELLQATASAANNAFTMQEAFQACLDRVGAFMSWPVGHVYIVHGDALQTSGWWHDDDPARFEGFRQQTSKLEFQRDAGMIGQVVGSGLATWLTDLSDPTAFLRSQAAVEAGLNSGFAFPVLIENEVVAVLEFYSERREEADLRLLTTMANIGTQLGRVVERERARKAAETRAEAVRSQSIRDELTGLYNRRGFLELARLQLSNAQRESRSALLFFVDLNGMKQINDNLGHEEGDRALNETADVLREAFRANDVIARLGGDEFVALMLDATCTQIDVFGTRIRQAMALRNARDDRRYRLSASVGAAAYEAAPHETIESLLVKADALMYEQKRARHTGQLFSLTPGRPPSVAPSHPETNPRG